jgi:xylitol oxidase
MLAALAGAICYDRQPAPLACELALPPIFIECFRNDGIQQVSAEIAMVTIEKNWSGVYTYAATAVSHPTSLDELRGIVARASKVHAVGSRHCFNGIADSAEILALDRMPMLVEIDRAANTVSVNPGMRYYELLQALEREGLAIHNTASLPHITVGGAVASATHGSGDKLQNLAGAVAAMELVTGDGEIVRVARGDADFAGMVVHVGALGIVSQITLDVEPSYRMRQEVFLDLDWDVLYERFDEIMSCGDSVSMFTDYGDTVNELWVKTRVSDEDSWTPRVELFGARAAAGQMHPVPRLDGLVCTDQMGVPGAWCDRLPHFKVGAIGDAGDEMQAEYMVDRADAVPGIRALKELSDVVQPYILAAEFRSVAPDDLWLSSAYQRETICLHYATVADPRVPDEMLPAVERALEPFAPRPHWGKLFVATAEELAPRYPKMDDFRALANRLDPNGKFRNAFLDRHVFGGTESSVG